jgi:hypothetical protein
MPFDFTKGFATIGRLNRGLIAWNSGMSDIPVKTGRSGGSNITGSSYTYADSFSVERR